MLTHSNVPAANRRRARQVSTIAWTIAVVAALAALIQLGWWWMVTLR